MNLVTVTPPARYPVDLAEVRLQLGLDTEDFDPRLAGILAAAVEHVETYTGRSLITRTYRGFLNWWPAGPRGQVRRYIQLEKPPLQTIAALTTYDDADNPTVYPAGQYYIDTARPLGRLVLRRGQVWPIPLRVADGIQVDWTAGYGDYAKDVPEPIRLAIQIVVAWLNEQRGDEPNAPAAMPLAATLLLSPYLVWPPA